MEKIISVLTTLEIYTFLVTEYVRGNSNVREEFCEYLKNRKIKERFGRLPTI